MNDTPLSVALLGAGTVGSQVARILLEDAEELTQRVGAPLRLIGIVVRDPQAPRDYAAPAELYTTDADALIDAADIVVELTGGIEPARTRILRALSAGKHVVSGNKALLAREGAALQRAADASGAQLSYDAAVAGAIPILRPLRDSLAGDRVERVLGIMNGTTNFILDAMHTTGADFDDALAEAQRLGYAEADPTADVEGHDAAAKAAIVASLAFHAEFSLEDVQCEGITGIAAADVAAAQAEGCVIKLLAVCERLEEGVSIRVHPTLVPSEHPLASVRGAYNAVFVHSRDAGQLMFYGPGAGGAPTASAVMGDLVSLARRVVLGGPAVPDFSYAQLPAVGPEDVVSSYTVGLQVKDRLGVLAGMAQVFAEEGVSIRTMHQTKHGPHRGAGQPETTIRVVTHRAADRRLRATIEKLRGLAAVDAITSVIRVEG